MVMHCWTLVRESFGMAMAGNKCCFSDTRCLQFPRSVQMCDNALFAITQLHANVGISCRRSGT